MTKKDKWHATEAITRLHDEVERLTREKVHTTKRACLAERERDEALAQVAVLARYVEGSALLRTRASDRKEIVQNLPAEARALFDRLRRAEAVIASRWEHRCSDGVGGCTAVSSAALAILCSLRLGDLDWQDVAEMFRSYARECVEEWREQAAIMTERRGCTKVACGPHEHTYAACPHNIAATLRALPVEKAKLKKYDEEWEGGTANGTIS